MNHPENIYSQSQVALSSSVESKRETQLFTAATAESFADMRSGTVESAHISFTLVCCNGFKYLELAESAQMQSLGAIQNPS
jgi:hypothetical protein